LQAKLPSCGDLVDNGGMIDRKRWEARSEKELSPSEGDSVLAISGTVSVHDGSDRVIDLPVKLLTA
jgi:hypothetical protein